MIEFIRPARRMWKCEHCGKKCYTKTNGAKHERGCTMNPNRPWGLCGWCGDSNYGAGTRVSPPLAKAEIPIDLHFSPEAFPECLKRVTEHYEGCPACILAEIRQAGMTSTECNFDFDACCAEWRERERGES